MPRFAPAMTEHQPAARSLTVVLGAYQRRLRLVAFVRYLPASAAGAIAILSATAIITPMTARGAMISILGGAALVAIAAGALALMQTPSLSTTANIVDRRFGLANLVVTALQFSEKADSVSRLIVANADARLAAHLPNELPLDAAPRIR